MYIAASIQTAVRASLLAGLAVVNIAISASAQQVGSVAGTIFDSVSVRPLAGADVYIWNTAIRTLTDDAGNFELLDVPSGDHKVVFLHQMLLEMGVSTGARDVEVRAGEEARVALGTPSPRTILENGCLVEGSSPASGTIVGYVGDDASGVALPGAQVHLTWYDELGSPHTTEALSDTRGWYSFCDAPADTRLAVTVFFLTRSAARQELTLPEGEAAWLEFRVSDLEPGSVTGTLKDQDRGWGVEDAEVRLLGTRHVAVSGKEGGFRFRNVAPGEYTLQVSHLAYGERTDEVSVGSSMSVTVTVSMSVDPIALAPMEVSVRSIVDLDGIVAGGTLVSREDVEAVRHRSRDLTDILRLHHMKDLVIKQGASGDICVGITTGQVRLFKEECSSAMFYLDGSRVSNPEAILNMSASDVDRVVVYRPIEAGNLFGMGSGNGVIVVYTRSGTRNRNR